MSQNLLMVKQQCQSDSSSCFFILCYLHVYHVFLSMRYIHIDPDIDTCTFMYKCITHISYWILYLKGLLLRLSPSNFHESQYCNKSNKMAEYVSVTFINCNIPDFPKQLHLSSPSVTKLMETAQLFYLINPISNETKLHWWTMSSLTIQIS